MNGSPLAGENAGQKRRWITSTVLSMIVAAAAFLPLLGHKPLADWDEAIYAEIARELLGRFSFTLTWQFHPWFEKPPLSMWLTAACFRLFAVNEFWARAVSAFSGIAVAGLIHGQLARVRGLAAAWASTLVLFLTLGFVRACHTGEVDMLLTLGCCVSLCGITRLRGDLGQQIMGRGWFLFWIGLSIAVMTKGAAAIVIPLTLVILLLWERWPLRVFDRRFFLGLLLFLVLVLPWHVVMYREYGMPFVREYLGKQMLARATSTLELHNNPPWFFMEVLLAFASPWVLVFPIVLWRGFREREFREYRVFALVVFALFTASQTRLPRYIVPMYPAIALLTADGICSWTAPIFAARRRWRTCLVAAVGAVAAFLLAVFLTKGLRERVTSPSTAVAAVHADKNFILLLRGEAQQQVSEPVLLCDDDGWMDLPSAIFYTRKKTQQVWLLQRPKDTGRETEFFNPLPLRDFVSVQLHLLLIPKRLLADIPANMLFTELHQAGNLVIGTISER
ncbi:4-amino-4-deoxy-L-arabinose transferase-like glycosyltransferase [Silvibacterium bohemicum]|uniref:4-amino-4-deoxy-L-arabinose transferase-like glycosyltransferase n=1 Tax=Silvibacterium bohemicum TaxID=1577686 RepID=A0A841JVM8_9BACT|nr:glycosyltransferase family 39 protein [Silvibacterium bohemicum]MBB6145442.1 4-amino-4-deoxy-L-arabinose transferase-like glycosyltransferase [Silvibacterium bohemicum]